MTGFAAVGAGRMGRGIAVAFAYAGHRIALIDLKPRTAADSEQLKQQARAVHMCLVRGGKMGEDPYGDIGWRS